MGQKKESGGWAYKKETDSKLQNSPKVSNYFKPDV